MGELERSDLPSYEEVCERFFALEQELDLFERTADGVHFWERVRFRVHREILQQLGLTGQAHTRLPLGFSTKAGLITRALTSVFRHNPFLVRQRELAFFGHPRRKKRADGTWWDIYCDPVIETLDHSYVYFEDACVGRHLRPARTQNIRYLDLATVVAALTKRLFLRGYRLESPERRQVEGLERDLNGHLGTTVGLRDHVERALLSRRAVRPVYDAMLRRIEPRLVVLVCGYGKENLIEACQDRGVTTVELQHGVIDKYHVGYSFPGKSNKRAFADHLFTFGDYWAQDVDLPISPEQVYVTGYPYFEEERAQFEGEARRRQVLFISQGTVGQALSRLAVRLSRILDSDWHIVYKLHPGEYLRWQREYPWLQDAASVQVAADTPPLYELFARSRVQVGVNSTALFEGLGFGLRTYLANLPGVARMKDLRDRGYARLVTDAEDLRAAIEEGMAEAHVSAEAFFASGSHERLRSVIRRLVGS